jgi:hypothetical protein|uniref:Myb-like domain-containing protein n=1 Tax=Eutreptiella gymnastica TaxID=73025 RepID=A0A7S4CW43_9EUGL|mmetsp:Transcript_3243/g.6188  ORF Transcript_3243/g.6188 Transcript_3243/m.6188 type:complete len:433 (-) Transcript_3243:652-1950(-)
MSPTEGGAAEVADKSAGRWNDSSANEFACGTRVSVKFHDCSEDGFSWYNGTILGPKTSKKYKIEYDDDDEVSSIDVEDEEFVVLSKGCNGYTPPKFRKGKKTKGEKGKKVKDKTQRMEELLQKLPEEKRKYAIEEGWCDAKITAYLERSANPNAFYYRFLPEGEVPKHGPWTEEEIATLKQICLEKKVNTVGSRPEWGIISQHIPGRVGYTCSAAYRKFVDRGEIEDPNYIFVNGRSKYVFGRPKSSKPKAEKEKEAAPGYQRPAPPESPATTAARHARRHVKKRRRARGDERIYADEVSASSEDEWDLGMKHFNDSSTIDWVTAAAGMATENPLPNFIDQITGDVVVQPCISPQGYVAGKRSWLAALEKRHGKCPFTNVKTSHRGLILLTSDNIAEHRDNIKNWEGIREIALSPVVVENLPEAINTANSGR